MSREEYCAHQIPLRLKCDQCESILIKSLTEMTQRATEEIRKQGEIIADLRKRLGDLEGRFE